MSLMQAMLSWKFISSVIFFMFMTLRYIIFLSWPNGIPRPLLMDLRPSGLIFFRINSFPAWHLPWLEWTFFENPDSEKIVSNCLVRFSYFLILFSSPPDMDRDPFENFERCFRIQLLFCVHLGTFTWNSYQCN